METPNAPTNVKTPVFLLTLNKLFVTISPANIVPVFEQAIKIAPAHVEEADPFGVHTPVLVLMENIWEEVRLVETPYNVPLPVLSHVSPVKLVWGIPVQLHMVVLTPVVVSMLNNV